MMIYDYNGVRDYGEVCDGDGIQSIKASVSEGRCFFLSIASVLHTELYALSLSLFSIQPDYLIPLQCIGRPRFRCSAAQCLPSSRGHLR